MVCFSVSQRGVVCILSECVHVFCSAFDSVAVTYSGFQRPPSTLFIVRHVLLGVEIFCSDSFDLANILYLVDHDTRLIYMISLACITGNNNLEPLLEGLLSQIHVYIILQDPFLIAM